jgi:3-dehydroquinate synthase
MASTQSQPGYAPGSPASEIIYRDSLPGVETFGPQCLLIYDQVLAAMHAGEPSLRSWLQGFTIHYPVAAGEGLKDVAAFPAHATALIELAAPHAASRLRVVGVGGGSVGDFAGFFASIFKRGVPLIHVPSTWLAAIDSAHGGKNALNVGLIKNQLGTYYFPERIYLIRALLATQPAERAQEAFGELAKIALIDGQPWTQELSSSPLHDGDLLWHFLPDAVAAKYRIVDADPLEREGLRHRLNLGHTLGHVLETLHKLPHGLAVAQGLRFALAWNLKRGGLSTADHDEICSWLDRRFALYDLRALLLPLTQDRFVKVLLQDKKRTGDRAIHFVFAYGFGRVSTEQVAVQDLVAEAIRQGYVSAE